MRRGGTPDPDCPECLESIVYLISKKRDITPEFSQTGDTRGCDRTEKCGKLLVGRWLLTGLMPFWAWLQACAVVVLALLALLAPEAA